MLAVIYIKAMKEVKLDSVGKVIKEYRDMNGRYVREVAQSVDIVDNVVYCTKQKWYECAICEEAKWVDMETQRGEGDGDTWLFSAIKLLDFLYCPKHAYLRNDLDMTLQQTLRTEASLIIRDVAERITRAQV